MKEVQALMGNVSKVLTDESRLAKVDKLITTIDGTVGKFGNVAGRLDGLMAQNQGKLVGALDSFKLAMKDVQGTTALVAQMLREGKFDDKVNAILTNLDKTTGKASDLVDELKAFATDPNLREPLAKSVKDISTITDSGTRMAADAEKMAQNGVKITEKVDKFADKANDLADNAKEIFEQIKKLIGRSPSTDRMNVTANLDLIRETHPGYTRMDVEAGFNIGENRLHAGIFDAFESNKITLQVGRPILGGRGEVRYGVYASKPGLGVEYEIARGLSLRGDVFDMNNPRLDVRARFDLGGGFYGWLGAQQLFRRNAFAVGVGFKVK
jgi:phospholipid/cholesterol/gamma-HCH transport system substrate-binding protein